MDLTNNWYFDIHYSLSYYYCRKPVYSIPIMACIIIWFHYLSNKILLETISLSWESQLLRRFLSSMNASFFFIHLSIYFSVTPTPIERLLIPTIEPSSHRHDRTPHRSVFHSIMSLSLSGLCFLPSFFPAANKILQDTAKNGRTEKNITWPEHNLAIVKYLAVSPADTARPTLEKLAKKKFFRLI